MARIFTSANTESAAKILMHDLTVAGGINSKNLRTGSPSYLNHSAYKQAAITICDELVDRNFSNIDNAIRAISNFYHHVNYDSTGGTRTFKPETIAKSIVYLASKLQLYWDDTIRTPYEVDEFKKTLLGNVVYNYGMYISAIPAASTSKTKAASPRTPGQPPKNNYKQSGAQSGNVRDLQGTPGQKVLADGNYIYKIIGDNPQSKNTPNVFIKPLSAAGAEGSTNKIFISSGNGYTDCTCYFDDPNDADAFLTKVLNSNRVPVNVSNLRVVKNKADGNGYFLVGTEFGVCAISAKTLNEALTECANNSKHSCDWQKATEGYSKEELEELHTWMRRD